MRVGERRPIVTAIAGELTRELEELIVALDERVPRVERAGEAGIARDAAELRAKAVARLTEIERDRTQLSLPRMSDPNPPPRCADRH